MQKLSQLETLLQNASKKVHKLYAILSKDDMFIRHRDNMKLLLICTLLLSHASILFRFHFFYQCIYGHILVEYCNLCILLVCLCILIVCLCIFTVPADILLPPWLRVFRAFSLAVRQMPGYNSPRRGTARNLPKFFVLFYVLFVLCSSVYCLCVNVYCTTATGWQPNCS